MIFKTGEDESGVLLLFFFVIFCDVFHENCTIVFGVVRQDILVVILLNKCLPRDHSAAFAPLRRLSSCPFGTSFQPFEL